MSIKVMNLVWSNSTQKGSALLLLLAIADHAHDDGGGAYPSIQTLADKTRLTSRAVQVLLNKLEAAGELRIKRRTGPHRVNTYAITIETKTENPEPKGIPVNPAEEGPESPEFNCENENVPRSDSDGGFATKTFHGEISSPPMAMRHSDERFT